MGKKKSTDKKISENWVREELCTDGSVMSFFNEAFVGRQEVHEDPLLFC